MPNNLSKKKETIFDILTNFEFKSYKENYETH